MKCLNLIGQCEGTKINDLEPPSMDSTCRVHPPLHFATTMLFKDTLKKVLIKTHYC